MKRAPRILVIHDTSNNVKVSMDVPGIKDLIAARFQLVAARP